MSLTSAPEGTGLPQPPLGMPFNRQTILVVEDEENIRNLIVSVLGSAGYALLQAANGADALELCVHSPRKLDLMITDCAMPLMSGVELIGKAFVVKPEMRVIMLSGKDPETFREIRGVSVLPKPFTIKGLLARIKEVLGQAA